MRQFFIPAIISASPVFAGVNENMIQAVKKGNVKQAGVCLSKGAGMQYGETPLMMASSRGKTDVVNYMLLNGSDPKVKDPDGKTAIDFASNQEIKDLLKNPPVKK